MYKKLSRGFYERNDVVQIARDLLGKELHAKIEGDHTSGLITEVEAYAGKNDRACHANNGKRTKRTETMYQKGGTAYIYLCYGVHYLLNVVTNVENIADAILIRAFEPKKGMKTMLKRRKLQKLIKERISTGPGLVTQALGITGKYNAIDYLGNTIWISEGERIQSNQIMTSKRIGIDFAGEDAHKLWRFYVKDSPWVTKHR